MRENAAKSLRRLVRADEFWKDMDVEEFKKAIKKAGVSEIQVRKNIKEYCSGHKNEI